jgi:hypothetical protein
MPVFGNPIIAQCPKCKRQFQLPDDWDRGETFICDNCLGGVFSGQSGRQADAAYDFAKYQLKSEIERRLLSDIGILCP